MVLRSSATLKCVVLLYLWYSVRWQTRTYLPASTCWADDQRLRFVTSEVTLAIKSSGRVTYLVELLQTIDSFAANLPILVVDDGAYPMCKALQSFARIPWPRLRLIQIEVDAGLSAGRNVLLDNVATEFVIFFDEDFRLTRKTNIAALTRVLKAFPSVIAVGGIVSDRRDFGFKLLINGTVLHQRPKLPIKNVRGCWDVDIMPNFFAARSALLREIKWDSNLKLGEHEDFFLRSKLAGYKSIFCSFSRVEHKASAEWQYGGNSSYQLRRRRVWGYMQKFLNKHQLEKYITQDGRLIVSNEKLLRDRENVLAKLSVQNLNAWIFTNRPSIVLLSWKRPENILKILDKISASADIVREVVVWNNSPVTMEVSTEFPFPVHVHNSKKNVNTLGRWNACSQFTTGRLCFFIDDDFMPTMFRQLLLSYERQPGVLHASTNAKVAWNNLRWGIQDSQAGIHASFSWVGSGAFVSKRSVNLFLRRLQQLKIVDTDICDNMFTYLMNQNPVLMLTTLSSDGLSTKYAYSRGTRVLNRLKHSRQAAIRALVDHKDYWFPNASVQEVPPLEALSELGNFVVISNAGYMVPPGVFLNSLGKHDTGFFVDTAKEAGNLRQNFEYSVVHSLFSAVDGDMTTFWQSAPLRRGVYLSIDLLSVEHVGIINIEATRGFFDLATSISHDGTTWTEYNLLSRMSFSESSQPNALICAIDLRSFVARYVRFTEQWSQDSIRVWDVRLTRKNNIN